MRAPKRSCLNIDDLPDPILVDILCRLPCASTAVQCKCVSKHWLGLISDPYFLRRFLRMQSHKQSPIIRTLIFSDTPIQNKFLSMSSFAEARTDNWPDFSFLPCFQSSSVIKGNEPVVLGAYNDLVLCSATKYFQRDYYICNPYTKKWVRLPLTKGFQKIRVGFICEPFYKEVDAGQQGEERKFELDFEYTYMVVRLVCLYPEEPTSNEYYLDVFCSETRSGRWLESIVCSPQSFKFDTLVQNIGLTYKGMLYWWSLEGFLIGVDPYSNINNRDRLFFCSFIDRPQGDEIGGGFDFLGDEIGLIGGGFDFLGVCRGRMRLCQLFTVNLYATPDTYIRIWELGDDPVDRWCLIVTLPIELMLLRYPSICDQELLPQGLIIHQDTMMVLGFDPNNEDILFLQVCEHIFMCNISAYTVSLTRATRYKSISCFERSVFPLLHQWWPTPVPKLR